jgi:glycerol-3-phosphate dehydrogenase
MDDGGGRNVVVVVGGGATGLGIAWDLALRGFAVTVVEAGDLGRGTSGRFHGLLHSGARYAVTDPPAAVACIRENMILRHVAPGVIEDTGGYFVQVGGDPAQEAYAVRWQAACAAVGIPVRPAATDTVRRLAPDLSSDVRRAFWVPDAVVEGFQLIHALAAGIQAHGGRIRTHTRLVAVTLADGAVRGVTVEGPAGRESIPCDALVNAAGPWAGEVARLYGVPLKLTLSRGTMILFAYRRLAAVVNRLAPPGDGDILVPHRDTAIFGTTDVPQDSPESGPPGRLEVVRLLALGEAMFPGMASWRVLRAFSGVRPLYQPGGGVEAPRDVTRDFSVIHYEETGGPRGVWAVVGGKLTTFRLMAERVADLVSAALGAFVPCRTAIVPLAPQRCVRRPIPAEPVLCECEGIAASDLTAWPEADLDAWRTRTWFAMGPCQGTFCVHRAAAVRALAAGNAEARREAAALRAEREKGLWPVAWGETARQWALGRAVRLQSLAEETAP